MKRLTLGIIMCMAAAAGSGQTEDFEGLSGRALADAVRSVYSRAQQFPGRWIAPKWMETEGYATTFVPPSWWYETPEDDLYNYLTASVLFKQNRYDYPPGTVDEIQAEGLGWKVGVSNDVNYWEPASDRKGDTARRMMYMALMYPQLLWRSRAASVFEDGAWPLLTKLGQRIYLEWHRQDPVDERELVEMAEIVGLQGNVNPFVELPGLAEYLWGDKAGMGYVTPATERERTPLRGVYHRDSDEFIDLYSPNVPADAQWKIDGKTFEGDAIALAAISDGKHEISLTASTLRGRLTINVEP